MSAAAPAAAETAERILDQGWAILRDVIAADAVARLRTAVDATMFDDETPFGANVFLGTRTRRVFNLLSHEPIYATVPIEPSVLAVAEAVLGPELLLSSLTAVETHPGQRDQPLHADDGSIPLARPYPPLTLVALWALTDFTEANGATRLVPGTHRAERRPAKGQTGVDTVTAAMPAGSVLLYNGSIWHGGGANTSEGRRQFIVCNYCAGWLRQEESQLLALDRERVAGLPPRLRRLVGYGVYRGLLGHVAGEDPGSWVDDEVETDLVWKRMG